MTIKKKRCLILSTSWFPIGIDYLEKALTKLCNEGRNKENTFVIGEVESGGIVSYQRFTFTEWVSKGVRPGKGVLRSPKLVFECPEVIMKTVDRPYIQKLPLKASNVFARDGYRCWYCGSEEKLTLDHITPLSKGGKSNWKNLITCCESCNHRKGDMNVQKFCEMKGCSFPKPVNVGSFPFLKALGKKYPDSWKKWLNFVD